jgi:hypothetical protein
VLVAAVVAGTTGCARQAEVTLYQPFARGTQQHIKLSSDRAYHAVDGVQQSTVLEFALPHSVSGPRAFVLYLVGPEGGGTQSIAADDPAGLRGFFIQEVGRLAGRTDLVAGTVQYHHVLFAPQWHSLSIDLRCDDGTEIRGQAWLREAPAEVHNIERDYAADIAQLRPRPEDQDATAPTADETPPARTRGVGSP